MDYQVWYGMVWYAMLEHYQKYTYADKHSC